MSGADVNGDVIDVAEELVDSDPQRALRIAERFCGSDDSAIAFRAQRTAALANRELQNIEQSTRHFEAALRHVDPAGSDAALTLLSVAGNHGLAGRFDRAHETLDVLDAGSALADRRQLLSIQRASIFYLEDRLADAVQAFERALDDNELDATLQALVLSNLGASLVQLGRFDEGRPRLQRALELYRANDSLRPQLDVLANLALCEAWTLNISSALAMFEEQRSLARSLGVDDGVGLLDEARALIEAGLGHEAVRACRLALERFGTEGATAWVGEAHLVEALAWLVLERPARAVKAGAMAREVYELQGRATSALLARQTEFLAGAGTTDGDGLVQGIGLADELTGSGYRIEAQAVLVRVTLDALELDERRLGRDAANAAAAWSSGTPASEIRRWIARAALEVLDGEPRRALDELDRGAGVLEDHRLTLCATELRAHSTSISTDLSRLALRIAFGIGDASLIWWWCERLRANTLELRPGGGTDNQELDTALAGLRSAASAARRSGDHAGVEVAQGRIAAILRTMTAPPEQALVQDPTPVPLSVTYFELDGWLHRVDHLIDGDDDFGPDGFELIESLAPIDEVQRVIRSVRFNWMRWLRRRLDTPASVEQAAGVVHASLRQLDELLALPADRPQLTVIVSEHLHGVPWSALPSVGQSAISVCSSASVMLRPRRTGGSGAALVAGPGLVHADDEVRALEAVWPASTRFDSERASVEQATKALTSARVVHFAAHGSFRPDNPMFSSVELADGPLTVIDLERIESPPDVAVLSACNAGLSAVAAGNECLGIVSALLAARCGSVIAPVLPILDADSIPVMVELHRRLSAGVATSTALRQAIDCFRPGSAEALLASSFVCCGQGH